MNRSLTNPLRIPPSLTALSLSMFIWGSLACQGLWADFDMIKTTFNAHSLHGLDMDLDGRDEVVLANPDRGSIDIYQPLSAEAVVSSKTQAPDPNQLSFNHSWKLLSLPVDRRIHDLLVRDLNGDKRPDILYHGAPENLVVLLQESDSLRFKPPMEFEIPAGLQHTRSLLARTVKDGTEIVIQHADRRTHLLLNGKAELVNKSTWAMPRAAQGQYRNMVWGGPNDKEDGLWIQLNDPSQPLLYYRHLGGLEYDHPERVGLQQTRFLVLGRFMEDAGPSFVQVRTQMGQLSTVDFQRGTSQAVQRRFNMVPRTIPLGSTGSKEHAILLHDINRDGADDIIVAHRESAQIELFLRKGDSFGPGLLGPCYKAVDFILPHADGVLVASKQEGLIGLAKFSNGRLDFPSALPNEGETICFLGVPGSTGAHARITRKDGKLALQHGKKSLAVQLEEPFPSQGLLVPLRGGALPELILEIPYQGLRILGYDEDTKTYANLPEQQLRLKEQELSESSLGAINLIASGNAYDLSICSGRLIRRYNFTNGAEVAEQVNLPEPNSASSLHRYVDLDHDGLAELVSYDSPSGRLDIFSRAASSRPLEWVRSQKAPPGRGQQLLAAAAPGEGRFDLLLAGQGELEWFCLGAGQGISANPGAIPLKDEDWAFSFTGTALARKPGGRETLILLDNKQNYLTMIDWRDKAWRKTCTYPVFNTETFEQEQPLGAVRELGACGPVERRKLLVLVHDRILIHDWRSGL